ncbi:MAG: hypothetical protein ABJB76_06115 [Candidatus Nitrosocosmicus sp.]
MIDYLENHYFLDHSPGLTVEEFDDIYNKEISKRYERHEIQRLSSKIKDSREREIGAIGGISNWIQKTDFLCFLFIAVFT